MPVRRACDDVVDALRRETGEDLKAVPANYSKLDFVSKFSRNLLLDALPAELSPFRGELNPDSIPSAEGRRLERGPNSAKRVEHDHPRFCEELYELLYVSERKGCGVLRLDFRIGMSSSKALLRPPRSR